MKFKLLEGDLKGSFESEEKFWEVLKQGFEVEREHADSMDNCPISVIRIALDHLGEDVEYYTKLKKMESGDQPKEGEKDDEEKEDDKESLKTA